jgi:enterochelin esterase family protein
MPHPLLAQAETTGTPLIGNDRATFVWHGAHPPLLLSDFTGWDAGNAAVWTQSAPGLWTHTVSLPSDAYMEYAFVTGAGPRDRIADPFNPRLTPTGLGFSNNWFYMPEGGPTPLQTRTRGVPAGKVTRHILKSSWLLANGKRPVYLYQPPAAGPCPLVVVYDGYDYRQRGMLAQIVDNLIAARRIRPIALALVDHGGPARGVEYGPSEATVGFVVEHVLPLARQHLGLTPAAGDYGIMGASAGGRMALYTGLRIPDIFGRVLSQSGAFKHGGYELVMFDLVRYGPARPLRIWMDCGLFEPLLDDNRDMAALLNAKGYNVTYREYPAGHNYPAWRDDLWRGLESLYPCAG